jgi:putative colanic acid biosynthesis acetyltransferase WcaF
METADSSMENHYVVSVFSTANKLKRLLWQIVWTLLCRWTPAPLYLWRTFIVRLFGGKVGKGVHLYPSCKIWAPWLLEMEDDSCLGSGVEVYNPGGCTIGKQAIISQDAYLCGATHDFNSENFTYIKKKITVGAYAWVCAKAIVLPGVTCGEGAVLGAAAIATRNLEPWSVYAGNPAIFIKTRNNFIKFENQ